MIMFHIAACILIAIAALLVAAATLGLGVFAGACIGVYACQERLDVIGLHYDTKRRLFVVRSMGAFSSFINHISLEVESAIELDGWPEEDDWGDVIGGGSDGD